MTGRLEGGSPGATTHWSAAAMAKVQSISVKFGAKHLARACLQPHRMRLFELSNDRSSPPGYATSSVSIWISGHAVVLSIDEKGQIQALDRAQPGLPFKKGR